MVEAARSGALRRCGPRLFRLEKRIHLVPPAGLRRCAAEVPQECERAEDLREPQQLFVVDRRRRLGGRSRPAASSPGAAGASAGCPARSWVTSGSCATSGRSPVQTKRMAASTASKTDHGRIVQPPLRARKATPGTSLHTSGGSAMRDHARGRSRRAPAAVSRPGEHGLERHELSLGGVVARLRLARAARAAKTVIRKRIAGADEIRRVAQRARRPARVSSKSSRRAFASAPRPARRGRPESSTGLSKARASAPPCSTASRRSTIMLAPGAGRAVVGT